MELKGIVINIPLSKLPSPKSWKLASVKVKNPPTFQPLGKFLESFKVAPMSPAKYLPTSN